MSKRAIFWFRRDLRLADNPALLAALDDADEVIPLFIMDDEIADRAGEHRRAYLASSLKALNESLDGNLLVISGNVTEVLRDAMKRYKADSVHSAFPFAPYGNERDAELKKEGIQLQQLGSGYAIAPGRVLKDDGTPYRVYTPFFRAWLAHGWRGPVAAPKNPAWVKPLKGDQNIPDWKSPAGVQIQEAGEKAALARFKNFLKKAADDYADARNIPSIEGTSRLSPHLRWGEIHPRTILAALVNLRDMRCIAKRLLGASFMPMCCITILIPLVITTMLSTKRCDMTSQARNLKLGVQVKQVIHLSMLRCDNL